MTLWIFLLRLLQWNIEHVSAESLASLLSSFVFELVSKMVLCSRNISVLWCWGINYVNYCFCVGKIHFYEWSAQSIQCVLFYIWSNNKKMFAIHCFWMAVFKTLTTYYRVHVLSTLSIEVNNFRLKCNVARPYDWMYFLFKFKRNNNFEGVK